MSTPLILRNLSRPQLIRALASSSGEQELLTLPRQQVRLGLAPVIAIARWIAVQTQQVMDKKDVSILVVASGYCDTHEGGRWYGFLPYLLGCSLQVRWDIVASNQDLAQTDPHLRFVKATSRIVTHVMTIQEYLDNNLLAQPDLAVLFQPGFERHHDMWFGQKTIDRLFHIAHSVMITSFQQDEYAREALIAEAYGQTALISTVPNPWRLNDMPAHTIAYHTLWGLEPAGSESALVNPGLLDRVLRIARDLPRTAMYQGAVVSRRINGEKREVCGIGKGLWFDILTGQLYRHGWNNMVTDDSVLPHDQLHTWPGKGADIVERIRWLADMVAVCMPDRRLSDNSIDKLASGRQYQHVRKKHAAELFRALRDDDTQTVRRLITERPALVHALNQEKQTPLYIATANNDPGLIRFCIGYGANTDVRDRDGCPAVHEAVYSGATAALSTLLELGAHPDLPNLIGQTALLVAIRTCQYDAMSILLDAGADMGKTGVHYSSTRELMEYHPDMPEDLAVRITQSRPVNQLQPLLVGNTKVTSHAI